MILLSGPHARGNWVEDPYTEDNVTYEYASDFDITGSQGHSPPYRGRPPQPLIRNTGDIHSWFA